MEMTMLEYLEMVGREKGRKEGVRAEIRRGAAKARASMKKALAIRGVDPAAYAKDLNAFGDAGKVSQLIVSFMAAKDPRAYLKRRFGH